ncbi:DJ-1/PfpI family protein [Patescibacteria group bacterium]|nr:DJ-1/PfpI family protein [Patescibacteria group bacterium]MBU4162091.1 DJ-1/PfpI family protein [Patescibacteria group bacterium]
MGKIAIIISFRNFRDEEYFIPKDIFLGAGFEVITVSSQKGTAIGGSGGEAEIDITFDEIDISQLDAVVFVGGPGAYKYIDDEQVLEIIRKANQQGKLLAAICIAPAIFAHAGVLRGKRATVWSSIMDKKPIKVLQENGAEYLDKSVVCDGNIITANGPYSAEEFGKSIVQHLTNNPKSVII